MNVVFNEKVRLIPLAAAAVLMSHALWASSAFAQNGFELNEQTFNQWVYASSQGQFDPRSELLLNLEAVDRVCDLSDEQEAKVSMAAQGDFVRFGRDVDELKSEYVGKTYDQNRIGEIYQKIQPLAQTYQAGLLGDESLFKKVIERELTSEQSAKYEEAERERAASRYAAQVRLWVVMLERTCPLTKAQRDALVPLILTETVPPKRFSQYDSYVVMYQVQKLPDENFQPILDEAQLKQLRVVLRQGAGMENFLRQQKLIDE